MRDGIYKTCPVPAPWKRVLRLALREADRGQRVTDAAEDALIRDIKRYSLADLVQKALALLESGQQNIFSLEGHGPLPVLPLPTTKMEQDFQEELNYHLSRNPKSFDDAVQNAVKDCLIDRLDNINLEIIGHIKRECPENSRKAQETIKSIKEAINEIMLNKLNIISTEIIDGSIPHKEIPSKATFDLDESLA